MENESVKKVKKVAEKYLDYKTIAFDADFNQIFIVNNKGQRYPLAYVDLRRVIMVLNGEVTNEEASAVKKEVAEYIIEAIKEKKSREQKKKNAKHKDEKTGE